MDINKKEERVLNRLLAYWLTEKIINEDEAKKLQSSYQVSAFDWRRATRYSVLLSVFCAIIAIASFIADDFFIFLIEEIFNAPGWSKSIILSTLAVLFYFLGVRRRKRFPDKIYTNEGMLFLGVVTTAGAVLFLGEAISSGSGHFSLLILLATIIYSFLGLWFASKLIWIFALLSLGSWIGAETGYISGWGAYYLGMNYPLRFVFFGLALTLGGSFFFWKWQKRSEFLLPTKVVGLLWLFIALWMMSIFGNYGDVEVWKKAPQIELFHWSIIFGVVAVMSIVHGLKYDDGVTKGFGITFIFINLYTRFFEYGWDITNKAIFFTLLAVSFWYLGRKAEKIWSLQAAQNFLRK